MKIDEFFALVSGLNGITRFSMLKNVHRENVLEHTGMIVCFAYVLGTRLNLYSDGYRFNLELLLKKTIVHDWDEIMTGDVARPTKYFSNTIRAELAALELQAVESLQDQLGIIDLAELHSNAKEGPEGELVKLCDLACVVHHCWEEVVMFSNMHFIPVAERTKKLLQKHCKKLELGQMSSDQWRELDDFTLQLHNILTGILKHANQNSD